MADWIIPLLLLIGFEAVADVFSEEFGLHGRSIWWIAAITGYIIANIFWLYAIRNGSGLARGAVIFSVGSALVAALIGVFFYKEKTGPVAIAGIMLGIVSVGMILWPGK